MTSRWIILFSLLAVATAAPAQEVPSVPEDPTDAPAPVGLRGVDLSIPTPDAFRSWPPKELLERPYWFPWAWMSFQRASLFDRPVLMVMTVPWNRFAQRAASETLRSAEVLREINDGFLSVFVSADRRPDLRLRYQSGTWPVMAFLLPNGRPMISQANPVGSPLPISMGYLPPEKFLFFVQEARTYYQRRRAELHGLGELWTKLDPENLPEAGEVREGASDPVANWLLGSYDAVEGGFGAAPKFVVSGLAEYAAIRRSRLAPALVSPARTTLVKLVSSPLYDDRGGGVHRIAAAPEWGQIQYEKMLVRNAELVRDLAFALRLDGSPQMERALRQTIDFLRTTLGRPGGGFYLAQCADPSSDDGGGYWRAEVAPENAPPLHKLVLSGPNALTGAALIRAGAYLDDAGIEQAGRAALDLVLERAYERGRGVVHVVEPRPDTHRFLVAQAEVAFALADAYEVTGKASYLDAARDIVDFALNNLLVAGEGALRDRLPGDAELGLLEQPVHPLEENARIARAMLRLAEHGLGDAYREKAIGIVSHFAGDLVSNGVRAVEPALAVEELIREPVVVRIEGPVDDPRVAELRRAAVNLPWSRVLVTPVAADEAGAVIEWKDRSRRVSAPEEIAPALSDVTGELPETS